MPKQLVAYASGPYLSSRTRQSLAVESATSPKSGDFSYTGELPAEPLQKIFLCPRNRTGHDFSAYKTNTIRRRIERRMNVHQIKQPQQYVHYLQENMHEIDLLFQELFISVTSFFRDPDSWETLAAGPLPEWLKSRPDNDTLRAWVPGCASGEEVFSLAIVMRECMEKLGRHLTV